MLLVIQSSTRKRNLNAKGFHSAESQWAGHLFSTYSPWLGFRHRAMFCSDASECVRLYGSAPSVIDCEFTGSPRRPRGNNTSNHTPGNWDLCGLLLSLFDQARYALCRRLGLFCVAFSHLYLFLHLSFCVILFAISPSTDPLYVSLFHCQGWKKPSKFWLVGYTRKSDGGPLLTCCVEGPVPGYLKGMCHVFWQ